MSLGQEQLGAKIREARESAGLSQQELAERIGVKQGQSVSNYERNQAEVSTYRLRRIAEATSKPMSFFLGDAEPEPDLLRQVVREEMAETMERVARIAAHLGLDDSQSA